MMRLTCSLCDPRVVKTEDPTASVSEHRSWVLWSKEVVSLREPIVETSLEPKGSKASDECGVGALEGKSSCLLSLNEQSFSV